MRRQDFPHLLLCHLVQGPGASLLPACEIPDKGRISIRREMDFLLVQHQVVLRIPGTVFYGLGRHL